MKTPIADFVKNYAEKNMSRMHMPGHKGCGFLGCEAFDITEVSGADSLYEADGIIAESEANATKLFGTGRTLFSTEGSSQCIRAMLYLAVMQRKAGTKPVVVAARNVHKAFVYAAALLDIEVHWLWPEGEMNSLCSCQISKETLEQVLESMEEPPAAVYVTSPDYLGQRQDVKGIAEICHKYGTLFLVDNAHGAYLHFTEPKLHPMDLGADICSDSAHKTLPVLTGGAYLQISERVSDGILESAKSAMALFGSTSPSYLTMVSLDLCNQYLSDGYEKKLEEIIGKIQNLQEELEKLGWKVTCGEPLKLTVEMPAGLRGDDFAEDLRKHQIECEYADPDFVVFMFTPENTEEDFERIRYVVVRNQREYRKEHSLKPAKCRQVKGIRESVMGSHEEIPVTEAKGRICASPAVSCPPAIPIAVSGEEISEEAVELFEYYGVSSVDVIKKTCYT